jgi:hypothetical protein
MQKVWKTPAHGDYFSGIKLENGSPVLLHPIHALTSFCACLLKWKNEIRHELQTFIICRLVGEYFPASSIQ